ncbi:MAG TPA: EamA family transporter, partial [Acidimicrobiia bacterium]
YTASLFLLAAVVLVPFAFRSRGWPTIRAALRRDWPRHLAAGVASLASYGLLLYASLLAPLSLVSAGREVAVVFAAAGGWWFLDERLGRARSAAVLVVALGLVVLAFGR